MTTPSLSHDLRPFLPPTLRVAGWLLLAHGLLWVWLLVRWMTFGAVGWTPYEAELVLADAPALLPYVLYAVLAIVDFGLGFGILREHGIVKQIGFGRSALGILLPILYFFLTDDFYGACIIVAMSGMLLLLLRQQIAWSLNYPAAFWLIVFFVLPMLIVVIVSLGERTRLGTVSYPLSLNPAVYLDDYTRFFSRINGDLIYLRIFWRSVSMAAMNTALCLALGYPFAYWIARRPQKYRNLLIFLVMIPFWTNFLIRTYAWMLILRDTGLINNFWSITLHEQAVALSADSHFFTWLADITSSKLPLLFNQPAVFLGLFYGFFPFVVLPLYSNLEKLDWSLLEAAADLGANKWYSTTRILLPLTTPGIVAAAIIVFIPSLGAYVTPDLLGGGKVALLGNLLQQQFMTVRDWPFGAAIGFIMMAMMLLAIVLYFRVGGREQ